MNPEAGSNDHLALEPAPVVHKASGASLSTHILPTSATMIGVCMTVLSIGQLRAPGESRWLTDKLLAGDALVFLASALLSFMSMRSNRWSARLEVLAEVVFVIGLALLALGAVALAFLIN